MLYSFAELCRKEVIEVEKGEKLVAALVIHGRERLFGLLGREQDLMIPFRQIRLIGTDTILVVREAEHGSTDSTKCTISKRFHIEDLFK